MQKHIRFIRLWHKHLKDILLRLQRYTRPSVCSHHDYFLKFWIKEHIHNDLSSISVVNGVLYDIDGDLLEPFWVPDGIFGQHVFIRYIFGIFEEWSILLGTKNCWVMLNSILKLISDFDVDVFDLCFVVNHVLNCF